MRTVKRAVSLTVVAVVLLAGCEQSLGLRLLAPEDGAVVSCSSVDAGLVRFSWTPVAAAQSYTIVVYDASGAQFLTRTTEETSIELELPCGASYSWQVAANAGGASSYWSGRRRFTVAGPGSGAGPQLVSPPDGAAVECQSPDNGRVNFDWTDRTGATSYTLEVYKVADGALFLSRTVDSSQTTETVVCRPELALAYRWRVGAHVRSQVFWSSFATFTVTVEKPFLVSPPNGATVAGACFVEDSVSKRRVLFTWTVVLNATSYRVDVFDKLTGNLVGNTVVTGATTTSATVTWTDLNACPRTYQWRVTAIKTAPNPPVTSDTWEFTAVP